MPSENLELRKAGLKVTLPRIKILQMLDSTSESAEHLSAEDV
jgi:Fur family ferric uptake transcriptional regulator